MTRLSARTTRRLDRTRGILVTLLLCAVTGLSLAACGTAGGQAGDWSDADAKAFTAECDSSGDVSDIYTNPQSVCECITQHVASRIPSSEYKSAMAAALAGGEPPTGFGTKVKQAFTDGFKACDKSAGHRKAIFNSQDLSQ